MGFQRPKSFVAIWFCWRPFLLRRDPLVIAFATGFRFMSIVGVEGADVAAGNTGGTIADEYSEC